MNWSQKISLDYPWIGQRCLWIICARTLDICRQSLNENSQWILYRYLRIIHRSFMDVYWWSIDDAKEKREGGAVNKRKYALRIGGRVWGNGRTPKSIKGNFRQDFGRGNLQYVDILWVDRVSNCFEHLLNIRGPHEATRVWGGEFRESSHMWCPASFDDDFLWEHDASRRLQLRWKSK